MASAARPPAVNARRQAALTGIGLTITACALFAGLDTITKLVSAAVPLLMILWTRYVFQSLLTTAYVLQRNRWRVPITRHPRFQVLRAFLFACTSGAGIFSISHMPLAEFTAILAATPLCVTFVAALWLGQPVSPLRWCLVVTGLASVLLILRPGGEAFSWVMLAPLSMLVTGTGYQVLSSKLAGQESPDTTQFYTSWMALGFASLALPWAWTQIGDPWLWLGMFCIGLLSATGHLLLLKAYAKTTPATIAPFLYSQIGFAMLAGWAIYGHMPDGWSLTGMGLIALSGAASAWLTVRETR